MSKRVIRGGDLSSHGGKMFASGAAHFTVDRLTVALAGGPCTCPKQGHKYCKIATGDAGHIFDGGRSRMKVA